MRTVLLLKTLFFIVLMVLLDKLVGGICKDLYFISSNYTIAKIKYAFDSTNSDIIILGSSRAENHFIPKIINQETGQTSYNCGMGGQGLAFSYIELFEITKRYNPKLVLLEVSPNILLDPESKNKLKTLLPYYNKDSIIYDILVGENLIEKLKLMSNIYPYNSMIFSLLKGVSSRPKDDLLGYLPLIGTIDTVNILKKIENENQQMKIPYGKFEFLKKIITLCKEKSIPLMVVVSPIYSINKDLYSNIGQIAVFFSSNPEVYFINYSQSPQFYKNSNVFKDYLHLNEEGAVIFSNMISVEIGKVLKISTL